LNGKVFFLCLIRQYFNCKWKWRYSFKHFKHLPFIKEFQKLESTHSFAANFILTSMHR